jgi:hypothetical protein
MLDRRPQQRREPWRVEDAPPGGSVVRAEIVIAGPPAEESRFRDLLRDGMRYLQRDVSDSFNAA